MRWLPSRAYRIATAPEPNSSRLTSFKSTRFDSPANNVGPWPTKLGCTTSSYSSINPSSNPVSRLVAIAVLAEPDELDKGAIVHDHGGSDAFRRRPGRIDDFLALESSLEVVDFE